MVTMKSNETNFVTASESASKPEFYTPSDLLACILTSVNPMSNRDRLYAWRTKMNVVGYFENREELK
jgi:hypothetical protein